jgi:flagellar basal body-associated protein FliL
LGPAIIIIIIIIIIVVVVVVVVVVIIIIIIVVTNTCVYLDLRRQDNTQRKLHHKVSVSYAVTN